ncbi:AzlD domain-containing protein [Pseudovibrio brasiliensis]|uniref:AzlD domain-containing protein n=1 Tax=Pseudovibrio brasiliensis TaxID=1898042 RepID=A0ABX8ARW3_9HYPH|nr:AzlD domain-containing protein [Pseudovibrio brasiliensis]QUS56364.1 AzlD domain-containing protein [Pseudovibrio brasiliensis]
MTSSHWLIIFTLAVAALSIRVIGLFAGSKVRASKHTWVLEELPGLIVVSLIATSLSGQSAQMWMAAAVALGVAITTNHVIATMCLGVVAFGSLSLIMG